MHLSKLTNVLQSFKEPEVKSLKEFVHSPYFNVPKAAITLFDYLFTAYPDFEERKLRPEVIGRKYSNLSTPAKQAWAGTKLLEAINQFIAVESWQKNQSDVMRNRLDGLKKLHLFDEFDKVYNKATEQLTVNIEHDVETFFNKHLYVELSLNGFDAKLKRTDKNDLTPVIQTLDEFYALKKLRYLCELIGRRRVFGTSFKQYDITPLLDVLKPYNTPEYPYVYLFVHVYLLQRADTFEEAAIPYGIIKDFISNQSGSHIPQSVIEAIPFAINHCLRWYNLGYNDAAEQYLWWIEWKMQKNLLLEHGKLMPVTFRNIIIFAVQNNRNPDWIDHVINNYSPNLPEEHRDTNLAFARGLYLYSCKSYKEAVRYLLLAQAGDEVQFNANIRRWQFMCLYECDPADTDTLFNHLLSFEKYLGRHAKSINDRKQMFNKFIHYSMELLKLQPGAEKDLTLTLQQADHFYSKQWLLEQLTAKERITGARRAPYQNILN